MTFPVEGCVQPVKLGLRAYIIVIVTVVLVIAGRWTPGQTVALTATCLLFLIITASTWSTPQKLAALTAVTPVLAAAIAAAS